MEQNKALNMFSLKMKKELKKLNPVCAVVKIEGVNIEYGKIDFENDIIELLTSTRL